MLRSKQNKYRNNLTKVDNITFHSQKEANRYGELKLLVRAGEITELELQPRFKLVVESVHVCDYIGDFRYKEKGKTIVEDVKGFKTPEYIIKRKLMYAVHAILIREI